MFMIVQENDGAFYFTSVKHIPVVVTSLQSGATNRDLFARPTFYTLPQPVSQVCFYC